MNERDRTGATPVSDGGLPELLLLGDDTTRTWLDDPVFERVSRSFSSGPRYRYTTVQLADRAPTRAEIVRADGCVFAGSPHAEVTDHLDRLEDVPTMAVCRYRESGPPIDPLLSQADLVVPLDPDLVIDFPRKGYETDADVYDRILREITGSVYEAMSPFSELLEPHLLERFFERGGRCELHLGSATASDPGTLSLDPATPSTERPPDLFVSVVGGGIDRPLNELATVGERVPAYLTGTDPVANLHAVRSTDAIVNNGGCRVLVLASPDSGEGEFDPHCGGCLPNFEAH